MSNANINSQSGEKEIVITRIFDAPKELVWKAWSDSEEIIKWWGPKEFTSPYCQTDFKVGGKNLFCMESKKDGSKIWSTGVYKEIIPFEKIVMTDCFSDENGNMVSAAEYGMEGVPLEMMITVTFEEVDGKTKMTLVHSNLPDDHHQGANVGWNESFDKLEASLK